MRKQNKISGWARTEDPRMVDIMPRGEEDRHIVGCLCECDPRLSKDDVGRQMFIHKSWDGGQGFEMAGAAEADTYERRAA